MDRLSFFKHGLSSVVDAATSLAGLKKAVDSFTDVVDEALSEVSAGVGISTPAYDAAIYDGLEHTLSQFAEMGYASIECGRYQPGRVHDVKCEEFYTIAAKQGLKVIGGHLNKAYEPISHEEAEQAAVKNSEPLQNGGEESAELSAGTQAEQEVAQEVEPKEAKRKDFNDEWWNQTLDDHRAMHCKYVVMSEFPAHPTADEMEQWVEYLNHIGEMALQHELKFCFHPKAELFKPAVEGGDKTLFDELVERCEPEKVWFAVDTYECSKAEVDTCALLSKIGQRVYLLHLHDYGIAGESDKIDFEAIASVASKMKVENMIVEMHTFSLPPMNCAERSLLNMESLPSIRY